MDATRQHVKRAARRTSIKVCLCVSVCVCLSVWMCAAWKHVRKAVEHQLQRLPLNNSGQDVPVLTSARPHTLRWFFWQALPKASSGVLQTPQAADICVRSPVRWRWRSRRVHWWYLDTRAGWTCSLICANQELNCTVLLPSSSAGVRVRVCVCTCMCVCLCVSLCVFVCLCVRVRPFLSICLIFSSNCFLSFLLS